MPSFIDSPRFYELLVQEVFSEDFRFIKKRGPGRLKKDAKTLQSSNSHPGPVAAINKASELPPFKSYFHVRCHSTSLGPGLVFGLVLWDWVKG